MSKETIGGGAFNGESPNEGASDSLFKVIKDLS